MINTLVYMVQSIGAILEIGVSDEFVEEHWGKRENYIQSMSVTIDDSWTDKQKALGFMKRRKITLINGIDFTHFANYSLFINPMTGEICFFNNEKFEYLVDGSLIYLIKKSTCERRLVYNGCSFIVTKGDWLLSSKRRLGKNHYRGIVWTGNLIYLKDHQLIAALYLDFDKALQAIGYKCKLVVNHRNLNRYDNRPENLEFLTRSENNRHCKLLTKVLMNTIRDVCGRIDGVWLEPVLK